jgi:hypothetical protein
MGRIVVSQSQYFDFVIAGEKDDLYAIIPLDLDDKITSIKVVQSLVERWQVDTVIFLTEAWTVEKSPADFEQDPPKALLIPPRLDPQRLEVFR